MSMQLKLISLIFVVSSNYKGNMFIWKNTKKPILPCSIFFWFWEFNNSRKNILTKCCPTLACLGTTFKSPLSQVIGKTKSHTFMLFSCEKWKFHCISYREKYLCIFIKFAYANRENIWKDLYKMLIWHLG